MSHQVGCLGGGQLGQMLALAGYPLGIRVCCFDSSTDVPAGIVGAAIAGDLQDGEKLRRWAARTDVVTYEWENFPAELVADLAEVRPVHPNPRSLTAAQDRWQEKRLFDELEIPIAPFRLVRSRRDLEVAFEELGDLVAKTRTGGYDGKGQLVVRSPEDMDGIDALLAHGDVVAEQWVPFDCEVSIIGVRATNGEIAVYPLTRNEHRKGILHRSTAPAGLPAAVGTKAEAAMRALLRQLDYVGVLALELFVVGERLLANEMAPRVHNSGHWTIEGAETSQFENHLRAICGLPLGSTALRGAAAMVNLIGSMPPLARVLDIDGAALHDYGKTEARPGRKLGHVTITATDEASLAPRLDALERIVTNVLPD